MLLTPKDVGALVDHTVWMRGKVLDVALPYAIVHFSSLVDSEQGPQRKVHANIVHLTRSKVQSDPELDLVPTGLAPPKKKSAPKAPRKVKAKASSTKVAKALV